MRMVCKSIVFSFIVLTGLFSPTKTEAVAEEQQTISCDLKNWARDWLGNKYDARDLKDHFSDTICHLDTDLDYCDVSAEFRSYVQSNKSAYLDIIANEILNDKKKPKDKSCILCTKKSIYLTIAKNPGSIQALCQEVGKLIDDGTSANLKYIFTQNSNCGFKVDEKSLADNTFNEAYWNVGDQSVRHWLTRLIVDVKGGRTDNLIEQEINELGNRLKLYHSKHRGITAEQQKSLEDKLDKIKCTDIEEKPCARQMVRCPAAN